MPQIQAIFFDLDNTLFDDDACVQAALTNVHSEIRHALPGVDAPTLASAYLKHSDAYWASGAFARSDLDEVRRRLWRMALADLGCTDDASAQMAADTYHHHRALLCEVYDDAIEILEHLGRDYRLAVVTNGGGETQRARLEVSGLGRYFDVVVASTDLDSGKPEPPIFLHTLAQLGIGSGAVWHVGDSLQHDVAGAHNAGLTSVWLNRHGATRDATHPEPHHEIASLKELATLLERAG